MIPGTTSKLSEEVLAAATTITPKSDLVRLTGTTAIATIVPPYAGFSGLLFIVPTGGNVATTTAGNISVVQTMLNNQLTVLVYSKLANKWFPHALS